MMNSKIFMLLRLINFNTKLKASIDIQKIE